MGAEARRAPRIDAHQHFWRVERGDYGWMDPASPLHRDHGPDELWPVLDRLGIDATVLVQAAPTEAETAFLLAVAAAEPRVLGVVGWTEFEAPDAADRVGALAARDRLVGLRPMVQDLGDDTWLTRRSIDAAFEAMEAHGLTFDALTLPRHLAPLLKRLGRHPGLRAVVDHASKPRIAAGDLDGWRNDIRVVARETDAFVKLSGLVTEAGADWSVEALRPVVDHLIDTFGPERMVWGSDWPVCTLACPYEAWWEETDDLLRDLTDAERDDVLGGNALSLYELAPPRQGA